MNCFYCNKELTDNELFENECDECGNKIETIDPEEREEAWDEIFADDNFDF